MGHKALFGLLCWLGGVTAAGCVAKARLDPGPGCGSELVECGDSCVDLDLHPEHCGACDNACGEDEVCALGECGSDCPAGLLACGGRCVDTRFDPSHCGRCGNVCDSDQVCADGACADSCGTGTVECGGVCVNLQLDPNNCGDCGRVCPMGQVCSSGICDTACSDGTTQCGVICTNLEFDPAHCGDCDNACPGAPNATASCANSICGITCATDFGDCDGGAGNGCEIDLTADANHCTMCGMSCPLIANGTANCVGSVCGLESCDTNYDNCDGDISDGCEAHLLSDESHCGMCNDPCTGQGELCINGGCTSDLLIAADGEGGGAGNLYLVDIATPAIITVAALSNGYIGLEFVNGTLHGITSSGDVNTIDPATGTETLVGNTGLGTPPKELVLDADGQLVVCELFGFANFDPATPSLTTLLPNGACDAGVAMATDTAGTLYYYDAFGNFSTMDTLGNQTLIATPLTTRYLKGGTFHNGTFYAIETIVGVLVTVDVATGETTEIGTLAGGTDIHGMASPTP